MMCWWAENPNGDEFKYHLARVPDYLWIAEDGMTMHSFGSQVWDCSLATQAILSSNMAEEYGDCLVKAHFYLRESQVVFWQNARPYIYSNFYRFSNFTAKLYVGQRKSVRRFH